MVAEVPVALTEAAGACEAALENAVAALTGAECFEFGSVWTEVVVGTGAEVVDGVPGWVGPVFAPDADGSLGVGSVSTGVAEVCAPPLLLTVTPEPTSVLDEVAPEVLVVPVGVGSVPVEVDVEPPAVEVEGEVPMVGAVVEPVDDSLVAVELAAPVDDEFEDAPVVSAAATPYPVATTATNQAATAMPPYPPILAALLAALRDGAGIANRGLTGQLSVMGSTPLA